MEGSIKKSFERLERAQADAKSKQPRFGKTKPGDTNFFASVMRWSNLAKDTEPEYRTDSRLRDKWLSDFWTKEPHWAGVVSQVNMIDSNRGWSLTGGRNQVLRYIPVLRDADDGYGWRQYCSQQSTSYYTTDMGSLTEIGRDGPGGPMRALYHLDPTKCFLTDDREFPLKYDKNKDAWAREDFFRLASMKNIREEFHGLGVCATSRVLDMAKIMLAVYNHELEQLGARAPKGLMLLQNISQEQWEEAMAVRDARLDSDMRKYYNAVAVIAQQGVDNIDAKLIALSQLPDGFNLEMFTNLLMYGYALCIGYDTAEFWPVQAGQIGRGKETDIQHRKGTGKGGLNFMLAMQEALQDELPETIHFEFEQRDQEGVLLDAKVAQAWSDVVMTLRGKQRSTTPGPDDKEGDGTTTLDGAESVITLEEARTLLAIHGVLPENWVGTDEEAKATDVKEAQREKLLENDTIRRAIHQYPAEPIVQYSWTPNNKKGKTTVLFREGRDALKSQRFSLVKPVALIPDFSGAGEVVRELEVADAEGTPVEKLSNKINFPAGWTIRQGAGDRLEVTVRDKQRRELPVAQSQQIYFYIFNSKGHVVLSKELGAGLEAVGATIGVDIFPQDTANLEGTYSCLIRVRDDFGRTFAVFKSDLTILKESVDA